MTDEQRPLLGYIVVANVNGAKLFRDGAKVEIHEVPGSIDDIRCYGLSKGGRRILSWVSVKRLSNPRIKAVYHEIKDGPPLLSKEQAEVRVGAINNFSGNSNATDGDEGDSK